MLLKQHSRQREACSSFWWHHLSQTWWGGCSWKVANSLTKNMWEVAQDKWDKRDKLSYAILYIQMNPVHRCHPYSKTCSWLSGYHGTMRPFHHRFWHIHFWCPKCWSKIYQKTACQDLPRTPRCFVSGSCSKGEANSRKPMPWHINKHINGSWKRCRLSSTVDGQTLALP